MRCRELALLQDMDKLHHEAALFLDCEATALPKAVTYKLLLRECRADQARTRSEMRVHRRNCPRCREQHPDQF